MKKNPYEKYIKHDGEETPYKDCNNKTICCGDRLEIKVTENRSIHGVVSKEDGEFILLLNAFTKYPLVNYMYCAFVIKILERAK